MFDTHDKMDIREFLKDLENYRPRRKGWTWRKKQKEMKIFKFTYRECSENLKNSIPLPAAHYFNNIDPQPDCVITAEIASGRFEDDIRRMRMAAWHGADHIMVIRTMGQSHFDGLIEGSPQGIGGVPITRKQLRATRKALDFIEDEVGRPINFHSYVSGVAGPEMSVLFHEEGINGAHQDPQYNVLYRNINMQRSFVDAAVAKHIMADAGIFQIDGAHNANATAREAWLVMPELMVQHALNCVYSVKAGMDKGNIGLSTVPPNSTPAPKMWYDLPYAVALRQMFEGYRMRAQMNTRYIESDIEEATVTHVIDTLISRLTSADLQSTITPDEGRNVPWHYNSIRGVTAAKQTLLALDGLRELVKIDFDGPLGQMVREMKERAVLMMEDILAEGGYFAAVEKGYFVDSAQYPERNGDGIAREINGGIGVDTIVKRDADYFAPVCSHFGHNTVPSGSKKNCDAINGCTFCNPDKIAYIDEVDVNDSCDKRIQQLLDDRKNNVIRPEVEWHGDNVVTLNLFLPESEDVACAAALKVAEQMGMKDPQIIHRQVMHPAEGTFMEIKGIVNIAIKKDELVIAKKKVYLDEEIIREEIKKRGIKAVAGTVGEDEHSVGMREILNIKHGGIEKYGIKTKYLGTSVPIDKMVDAAIETGAQVILISTIISHDNIHRKNMRKLADLCTERGIRDKIILISGGTSVNSDMALDEGLDMGFGRGTKGMDVVDFIVRKLTNQLEE